MKFQANTLIAIGALVWMMQPTAAQEFSGNDLRELRIGQSAAELPDAGYVNFTCAIEAQRKLSGWSGWRDCPAGADGLHGVRFAYDPETSREGTMVAGHPAVLTVLIDDAGVIGGLQIETDPKARLYLRKKAFLLGPQVKSRYGLDGWTCTQAKPESNEQPVGGVYVNEHCTKTAQGRWITVDRSLFRRTDQDARSFTDQTRIAISRAGGRQP